MQMSVLEWSWSRQLSQCLPRVHWRVVLTAFLEEMPPLQYPPEQFFGTSVMDIMQNLVSHCTELLGRRGGGRAWVSAAIIVMRNKLDARSICVGLMIWCCHAVLWLMLFPTSLLLKSMAKLHLCKEHMTRARISERSSWLTVMDVIVE